jgi:hypothetical protein
MDTFYLVCAIIGGTLMVGQFVLSLMGLGHDSDADASGDGDGDHGSSWFAGVLSLRAISAAVMLFGLCGLWANYDGREVLPSLAFACLGGFAGLLLVAQLMRFLHGLSEEGNVQIESSVGKPATVYLTIPGKLASAGKVQLELQNRTVEYQAVTAHPDSLPTGSRVTVVAVVNSDTVEVTPEPIAEANSHA